MQSRAKKKPSLRAGFAYTRKSTIRTSARMHYFAAQCSGSGADCGEGLRRSFPVQHEVVWKKCVAALQLRAIPPRREQRNDDDRGVAPQPLDLLKVPDGVRLIIPARENNGCSRSRVENPRRREARFGCERLAPTIDGVPVQDQWKNRQERTGRRQLRRYGDAPEKRYCSVARPHSPADERKRKEIVSFARLVRGVRRQEPDTERRSRLEVEVDHDAGACGREENQHRSPAAGMCLPVGQASNDAEQGEENRRRRSRKHGRRVGRETERDLPVPVLDQVAELNEQRGLPRPERGNVILPAHYN